MMNDSNLQMSDVICDVSEYGDTHDEQIKLDFLDLS